MDRNGNAQHTGKKIATTKKLIIKTLQKFVVGRSVSRGARKQKLFVASEYRPQSKFGRRLGEALSLPAWAPVPGGIVRRGASLVACTARGVALTISVQQ
jgi:hypothetical protein